MLMNMEFVEQGIVVPESVLSRQNAADRYGDVPGLNDEEFADPAELERQVYLEGLGPVLAIPMRSA
jgi:hypothetical protein